jgi:DNA-binding MurR/RpiR family transcriptional regulator
MIQPVSQKTEGALRAAMKRLLEGASEHTDGRLSIANLAREAGVSRATANRAAAVLAEFRAAEARFRLGSVAGLKARIRELEAELRAARGGEMAELRATVKSLAQQIQILALQGEEQRRLIAVLGAQIARADPKVLPFKPPTQGGT